VSSSSRWNLWSRTWVYAGHASQSRTQATSSRSISPPARNWCATPTGTIRVLDETAARIKGTRASVGDLARQMPAKTFRAHIHAWTYRTVWLVIKYR